MSKVLWLCVAAALCAPGLGQQAKAKVARPRVPVAVAVAGSAASVPADAQDVLNGMAARAAVIFAGHVIDIAHNENNGFVDVRFRVDEPVRGCNKLGVYVLREWAGLWVGEAPRYRLGERLLMLLTARGPSGMSAPVGGNEGVIPIGASAVEPLAVDGVAPAEDGSVAADVNAMTADLRWVQARAVRALAYAADSSATAAGDAPGAPIERWGPVTPIVVGAAASPAQPTVGAVLSLLRGTQGSAPGAGSVRESR